LAWEFILQFLFESLFKRERPQVPKIVFQDIIMNSEFKDFYKPLGLEQSASQDEIKKVFRKLARKYHPDVNKSPGSEAKFKEISEAYDVLSDPKKRADYDQLYGYWKNGGNFQGNPGNGGASSFHFKQGNFSFDVDEIFKDLFGERQGGPGGMGGFGSFNSHHSGSASPFSNMRSHKPEPQTVNISLEEAFSGCKRQFEVNEHGQQNRQIRVTIPAGVKEGQIIRLGAKPGNKPNSMSELSFKVHVQPHKKFRLEGHDVYLELPVTPWEAALGATITVPTLGGSVHLKIPANSQSGKKMALKGRGLPGQPPGTQYVVVKVVIPIPTSDTQKALYKKMATEMAFNPRSDLLN
jgi:curved DNA-binding protein